MKKNLALFALSLLSPAVMAAPSLYTKCEDSVRVPAGGGAHYFDESCKTIYVGPVYGRKEFKVLSERSDIGSVCGQIKANLEERVKLAQEIVADSDRLLAAVKAGEDVTALMEEIDKAREERIQKEQALMDDILRIGSPEAAVVEVQYYSGLNKAVQEYRKLNPNLNVEPLTILVSGISIIEKFESDSHILMDPIISHQFNQAEIDPIMKAAKFHEGISTTLRINYFGLCGQTDNAYLDVFTTSNLTYGYQVEGKAQYGTAPFSNN